MASELKVIADFYDFMLWVINHTQRFPRHHRYTLGIAIENRLQQILTLLLRAKYSKDKSRFLDEANIELEVLRFQVRMTKDLKILPVKSHGYACEVMQSVGAQIGGWLREKRSAV
jgi:hypothetical protein